MSRIASRWFWILPSIQTSKEVFKNSLSGKLFQCSVMLTVKKWNKLFHEKYLSAEGGKKDRQKNKSFKMKIYLYVWLRVNEIIFEIAQRACKWGLKILKTFKELWDPIHFWKLNARIRDHSAERHDIPLISQWSGVTPFPLPYMCTHTHTQRTIYIIKHDNKNTVKT